MHKWIGVKHALAAVSIFFFIRLIELYWQSKQFSKGFYKPFKNKGWVLIDTVFDLFKIKYMWHRQLRS